MLILTRKTGQGFRIGDDVEITITEISGDKVRVGIEAPREVKVLRSELKETMESNQQASVGVGTASLRALGALARGLNMGEKTKPTDAALKGEAPPRDEEK